ncbi:MAG: YihY/virulence factor BrkB family protein [Bacteroidales bacterium]|nr:YihY/virulence factor BrkB family protein [Bacteroidales bacterium]
MTLAERWQRLVEYAMKQWDYCSSGVWQDTRPLFRVKAIKVANLCVRSFMNADLQTQACAMTYRTLLAIVPALALLFAIGRGFGFQNLLRDELFSYFPSQHRALEAALSFVDSYLEQASEGIFVGVGIVFLLWTLISLVGSVEDAFDHIWMVKHGRTIWRKLTDYTAIFLILPVLMICASGLTLLMTSTLQKILDVDFLKPAINWILDLGSYAFTWLFFAGAYKLIPNTKVNFGNALGAGIFVGTAFQVLQWLFVSGQMYVAKYNAIYGSFSFLPLLLIWLQLVWLITLIGALVCFASQNAGQFNFNDDVRCISPSYHRTVCLTVMTIIAKRFRAQYPPLTLPELAELYGLPVSLVKDVGQHLNEVKLINFIESSGEFMVSAVQPAVEVSTLSVGDVVERLQEHGSTDFIPDFMARYSAVERIGETLTEAIIGAEAQQLLINIEVDIDNTIPVTKKLFQKKT